MSLTSGVQATIFLQFFSNAVCQFPMPFPMSQMSQMTQMGALPQMGPMGSHSMAPLPPLAPQSMFPPPMPMAYPMQRKMPSVVMPYYSRSANRPEKRYRRKHRKHKRYDESYETDNEFSESGSAEPNFRRSRSKKRRQVLTPVVSYVTKDGYVVYQKKIKKDKAKEWLELSKKNKESKEMFTSAEEKQFQKMLKYKKKKKRHN